jgi:hypothetical protein
MKAIVTFQGFTEGEEKQTGTEDLFFTVIRNFASEKVTTYHPRTWSSNVRNLAAQLQRQGIKRIVCISYSHGQAAVCDIAKICGQFGMKIELWLACDPVYRPTWLPRHDWLQPLAAGALNREMTITVPSAIERVVWCRQELTFPRGHKLIPAKFMVQEIAPAIVLRYSHTTIDHADEWHETVKLELEKWAKS